MAKIQGNTGNASFSGTTYYITGWTLDKKTEVQDTTDSSDSAAGYKSFIGNGWSEWEGTFEGYQETGTADPAVGTSAALILGFNTSAVIKYSGSAIITSISTNLAVVSTTPVKKTFTFKGTGALTLTNA